MVVLVEDAVVIGSDELQSTHTRALEVRGEVLSGPERRRRWSTEEKLRVLAQSVALGSSPAPRFHRRRSMDLS
jgi:transposase